MSKRTTTPSYKRRVGTDRNRAGPYEGMREEPQFEGLQIYCLGNEIVARRVGTSNGFSHQQHVKAKAKFQKAVFPQNPLDNVLPNFGINPINLINPLKSNEVLHNSPGPVQHEAVQQQKTLFPYRKAKRNPVREAKGRINNYQAVNSESPVTRNNGNEEVALTAAYLQHANRSGCASAITYTTKPIKNPRSPKKTIVPQVSLPYNANYPKQVNNLISVGHNISHVWNYHIVSPDPPIAPYNASPQYTPMLPSTKLCKSPQKPTRMDPDLRLLQTLLKSGNLPGSLYPLPGPMSNPVLSITRKPQFLKAGVCRSGSTITPGQLPGCIYSSQLLESPLQSDEVTEGELHESNTIEEETNTKAKEDKIAKANEIANYMAVISSNKYKFIVTQGNNSTLVKKVLEARPWWIELTGIGSGFNFKWQPFSYGLRFDLLNATGIKQMVNHFEFHAELSSKSNLFINLQTYSEINKENVFNFVPITFYIEINPNKPKGQLLNAINKFAIFHKVLEENKGMVSTPVMTPQKHSKSLKVEKVPPTRLLPITYDKRGTPQYTRYTMPLCHFEGHNLWLLKPTHLNRGRGIHVFRDLETLKELITKYCHKEGADSHNAMDANAINMANSFIIQKYIERPLLINSRKFDIRVWVLLTHDIDCYFFKEGYLRTTSTEYKIDPDNVDDKFVHLTNNAIQKYSNKYGSFEDGNQISFQVFQKYLDDNHPDKGIKVNEDLLPNMKHMIKKTILSVRKKLDSSLSRKASFELFGYDFIIDENFNLWLIEVNTNPCLEESSDLLKALIPRMLNDAFKLTLDCIFPPLTQYITGPLKRYPVEGYTDDENMWELLCGTTDHSIQVSPPPTILRSAQVISVNDDKNISVTKPKTPKKALSALGKSTKKKSIGESKKEDQKTETTESSAL